MWQSSKVLVLVINKNVYELTLSVRITDYGLRLTGYGIRRTEYGGKKISLPASGCQLPAAIGQLELALRRFALLARQHACTPARQHASTSNVQWSRRQANASRKCRCEGAAGRVVVYVFSGLVLRCTAYRVPPPR